MTTDEAVLRILGETTVINAQLSAMGQQVAAMIQGLMLIQSSVVALVAMTMLAFGVWWWYHD